MFTSASKSFTQRLFSFSLAAVLTLGMLGGIDQLSLVDSAPAGWANQTTSASQG